MSERRVTEEEIKSEFGFRTYEKGWNYFEDGRVYRGVFFKNKLIASVQGSMDTPYTVIVEAIPPFYNKCSCPLGGDCKHVVATLLSWIHSPRNFLNGDYVKKELEKLDKETLLDVIFKLIEKKPSNIRVLVKLLKIKQRFSFNFSEDQIPKIEEFLDNYKLISLSYLENEALIFNKVVDIFNCCEWLVEKGRHEDVVRIALKAIRNMAKINEAIFAEYYESFYDYYDRFYALVKKYGKTELFNKNESLARQLIEAARETYFGNGSLLDFIIDLSNRENYKHILKTIEIVYKEIMSKENVFDYTKTNAKSFWLSASVEILAKNAGSRELIDFLSKNKPDDMHLLIGLSKRLILLGQYNIAYNLIKEPIQNLLKGEQYNQRDVSALLEIINDVSQRIEYKIDSESVLKLIYIALEFLGLHYHMRESNLELLIKRTLTVTSLFNQFLKEIKESKKYSLASLVWHFINNEIQTALEVACALVEKEEIKEDILCELIFVAYEKKLFSRKIIPLLTKIIKKDCLLDDEFNSWDKEFRKDILKEALKFLPEKTVREIVDEKLKEYRLNFYGAACQLLTLYSAISNKETLLKISKELIPNVNGKTMEMLGSKMEKIDPQYAVEQYLVWIHTHVPKSHTYYSYATKFICKIRELLVSANKEDEWFSIISDIYSRYATRKKFIEKLESYL